MKARSFRFFFPIWRRHRETIAVVASSVTGSACRFLQIYRRRVVTYGARRGVKTLSVFSGFLNPDYAANLPLRR